MDTERTIILENVGDHTIGLGDVQEHVYVLQEGQKRRISAATLQDILDKPSSRIVFEDGLAKIRNIDRESLYNMGLTEDEINDYLIEEAKPIAKAEAKEEKIEDKKDEEKVVEKKAEKTTPKKSSTKKASSAKSK